MGARAADGHGVASCSNLLYVLEVFFFSPPALCLLSFFVSSQSCSPVLLSLLCFSPGAIVADCDSATLPGTGGTVRFGFEDHNATSVATTGRPAARAPFVAVARIPGTGLVSDVPARDARRSRSRRGAD